MAFLKNYSIRNNRLKKACLTGMTLQENGVITLEEQEDKHNMFLGFIDSAENDTRWGRVHFHLEKEENQICILHAYASDYKEFLRKDVLTEINGFLLDESNQFENKKMLFEAAGEEKFINQEDVLLYNLRGRYLWLFIEVYGVGNGFISDMQVTLPGDNFMNTFPAVYQEDGSFFHRYISIFSSIYNDFQQEIDQVAEKLDLDKAPAELLPVYANWFGVDVSGDLLTEEKLRGLVKEVYQLNRMKGTKQVLERLTELVLGEKATIVEKNIVFDAMGGEETEKRIYGKTPYDVTMLVKRFVDENTKSQLIYLLKQFIPIRCRLNIIYLQPSGVLDSYSYLDINAQTYEEGLIALDKNNILGSVMKLQS